MNNESQGFHGKTADKINSIILQQEVEIAEKFEELNAQKEELTAAIEEITLVNNQLIERNKELDLLLYKSSHDLISPVVSIEGLLQLIEKESVTPNISIYLSHIQVQNNKMKGVISTLQTLAKVYQQEWNNEILNVLETTKKCIESLSHQSNYVNIDFEFEIDSKLEIIIDKFIFQTIITNLASNSINFCVDKSKNGQIKLAISHFKNKLEIRIEDNGLGISTENGNKIYDMFYKGSEKSSGVGMGLYTIKKIAERMKGTIRHETKCEGVVFFVTLTTNST